MDKAETELWRTSQKLAAARRRRKGSGRVLGRLPPLLVFTDPLRMPDPVEVAGRLPRGAGLVYRHFGAADAEQVATALAAVARRRGLVLLIGGDEALAAKVGAAGVHLPERACGEAARIESRRPGWLVTVAAHGARGLQRAEQVGAHAAVLSPVFASLSPSAGRPLGPMRFAVLALGTRLPTYALGGIDAQTARRLGGTGAAGVATVGAFARFEHRRAGEGA